MKPKRKVQTYKDFLKRPPNPNKRTDKLPGHLELVPNGVLRYGQN